MSGTVGPAPPEDVDDVSKALWTLTIQQLQAQGTWEDSDAQVLERYIRALERARQARETLRSTTGGELKLMTRGSTGQFVQHPNVKTAREAERDAHQYANDLLLTPAARQRHEIEGKKADGKFGGALS